jgi:hypothetical protein
MSTTLGHRLSVLGFMGALTAYLLARAAAELAGGLGGALEGAVYGVSGALGLQFVVASWRGLWGRPRGGEQPQA